MAVASDMKTTIVLIRDFWPDLQFTKEDIVSGNISFISQFYTMFVAELNDKVSFLMNEEMPRDEFDDIQDFDKRVILYCKVSRLFKYLKYTSLNLADFYIPNPKKMCSVIKQSIHFVIYVNNSLDEITVVVNENLKKLLDNENFKTLKQQFLQDSAENAETLARSADTSEILKFNLDKAKQQHDTMIADKLSTEKINSQKESERSDLQNEEDNLEYELKLLEDKEKDLKESIITEKDFDNLKNLEKYLEIERQQCNSFETNDCIDKDIEDVKYLEEHAKNLSLLTFESWDVVLESQDLKKQSEEQKAVQKKLSDELISLNNIAAAETLKLKEYKRTLDKTQVFCSELKDKTTLEERNEQKCYENKVAKCTVNFEEYQRLESEIICAEDAIKKVEEEEEHTLNACVAQVYRRILDKDRKVTKNFHNSLVSLKNYHFR